MLYRCPDGSPKRRAFADTQAGQQTTTTVSIIPPRKNYSPAPPKASAAHDASCKATSSTLYVGRWPPTGHPGRIRSPDINPPVGVEASMGHCGNTSQGHRSVATHQGGSGKGRTRAEPPTTSHPGGPNTSRRHLHTVANVEDGPRVAMTAGSHATAGLPLDIGITTR